MRIVSRAQLMELPAGTVYSYYEPHVFHGLEVKDETCVHEGKPIDWFTVSLLASFDADSTDIDEKVFDPLDRGEDVPLVFGECYGRDGCFDDKQQYAVWSKNDISPPG